MMGETTTGEWATLGELKPGTLFEAEDGWLGVTTGMSYEGLVEYVCLGEGEGWALPDHRVRPLPLADDLWRLHYTHPTLHLCSLCGNTGVIDTRGRAVSPAGYDAGMRSYCLCPNGRAMREADPEGKRWEGR